MDIDFWGVVIEPGDKKKIDCPEDILYHLTSVALDEAYGLVDSHVKVYVEVRDEKFAIGTLSSERQPQIKVDLCFREKFALFHTSLTSKVAFVGYQVRSLGKLTESEGSSPKLKSVMSDDEEDTEDSLDNSDEGSDDEDTTDNRDPDTNKIGRSDQAKVVPANRTCKSCNKVFSSIEGMRDHTKAKHS